MLSLRFPTFAPEVSMRSQLVEQRLSGQGLVEYALIILLVAIVVSVAVATLGDPLFAWYSGVSIPP